MDLCYIKVATAAVVPHKVGLTSGLTRDAQNELLITTSNSNFKLGRKCSFHTIEVPSVARNAKLHLMYPLPKGVTVR